MPGYGRFETVEQVASSGPFTLYSARPAGESKPPELAIKVYEGQAGFIGPAWERKANAFLEAARIQKTLADKGAEHWAPIFAAERTEDAAYYVSRLYSLSAKRLTTGAWQRSSKDIAWVAGGVVSALIEMRDLLGGRAHGNLHSGNVLIGDLSSGAVAGQPVVLTDPAAEPDADALLADQVALGRIIFELVMRREAPRAGGFAVTSEWSSLGAAGKALHDIADSLMSPQKDAGPLEQIRQRLQTLPAGGSGSGKLIGIGAAAAVLLAGGAALMVFKPWQPKLTPPPPPPPPPPAATTGACVVLDAAKNKWTCTIIERPECEAVKGKFFGEGSPCQQSEYLVDPRDPRVDKDWPGQISAADRDAWLALQTDARYRKGGLAEFTRLYDDPIKALNAAVEVTRNEAKWVPGLEGANMSLSPNEQARIVAAANKLKADIASFSASGERFASAKKAISDLTAELDQQQINDVLAELAKAEAQVESFRADYGDDFLNSISSFATLRLAPLKADLEELKRQTVGGQPTPEQIAQATKLSELVRLLPNKINEVEADLKDKITDTLQAAAAKLKNDIPKPLKDALIEQINKLAAAAAKPAEKLAKAEAAGFWAGEIQKAFEIAGIGNLEGVFDAKVFESLKGERSKAAVEGFAKAVAALPSLPRRDDAQFRANLEGAANGLRQWGDKVGKLSERARQVRDLLDMGFAPAEKDAAGKSIDSILESLRKEPEWAELKGAFKPLEDSFADLDRVARGQLNEGALVNELPAPKGEPQPAKLGRMLAAWSRVSTLPNWPATYEQLTSVPVTVADLEHNIDASKNNVERKNALKAAIRERRTRMWSEFVSTRLAVADVASAFSPETCTRFEITDKELGALTGNAAFNWALLRAKAEAAGLKDGDVAAFVDRWAAPLASDAAISRAFDNARKGKFGTEWKDVGPGAAGWSVIDKDEETFAVYSKGGQTLRFKKVNEAGGMLCTTEVTIGLAAMILAESKPAKPGDFAGAGKPNSSVGPSPWFLENGAIVARKPAPGIDTKGWLAGESALQGVQPFASGVNPAEPTLDLPINRITAAAAMSFAHAVGCRLPTADEWSAARAGGVGEPNIRDSVFATQCDYARGLAIGVANYVGHFPSGGRCPIEGGVRKIDEKADCTPGQGNDGILFFRPVPAGSASFTDLEGNVAEWVVQSANGLEVTVGVPLASERLGEVSKALKDVVGVVGGSAISPIAEPRTKFVKGTEMIQGFNARGSDYSDVGFRLAFTAEGGGGGGGKSAADWVRKKLADIQLRPAQ